MKTYDPEDTTTAMPKNTLPPTFHPRSFWVQAYDYDDDGDDDDEDDDGDEEGEEDGEEDGEGDYR